MGGGEEKEPTIAHVYMQLPQPENCLSAPLWYNNREEGKGK